MFVRWQRRQLAECLPTREYIGPPQMEIPAWARYIEYMRAHGTTVRDAKLSELRTAGHDAVAQEEAKTENWAFVRPAGIHDHVLYAYLCESKRVGGTVQSRTIAYLSSIKESQAQMTLRESDHGFGLRRLGFWLNANDKLNDLQLAPQLHAKLLRELARKVAPLSTEDIAYVQDKDSLSKRGKAMFVSLLEQWEQANAA